MKILSYKYYMLMDSFRLNEANEELIQSVEDQLQKLRQSGEQLVDIDEDELNEIIEIYKAQPFPENFKKALIIGIKAAAQPELIKLNIKLFEEFIKSLKEGKTQEEATADVKDIITELSNLMVQKLGITREELELVMGKYISGVKKYSKSKQDAAKVSDADPYGEEEWDGLSEEDRIRMAFEEENEE